VDGGWSAVGRWGGEGKGIKSVQVWCVEGREGRKKKERKKGGTIDDRENNDKATTPSTTRTRVTKETIAQKGDDALTTIFVQGG